MIQSIDVLLVEPTDRHSRQTLAAIRRFDPRLATLRVVDAQQAARVMFEQGLFTAAPQLPGLIIVDLSTAGDDAKGMLQRLKSTRLPHPVPVALFSERRTAKDILDAHLLGAHLNLQKPLDAQEYTAAVQRIIRMWTTGSLLSNEATAAEHDDSAADFDLVAVLSANRRARSAEHRRRPQAAIAAIAPTPFAALNANGTI